MAITHIHKIEMTPHRAIAYATNDKIDKLRDNVASSIAYAERDKSGMVTYYTLSSYQLCAADTAARDFSMYSENYIGKKKSLTKSGNDVLAWHLVQSFDEQIPPQLANEIGAKLAREVFGNHACVISTHTNTNVTHNHIIICAWDIHGKKWNNCNDNTNLIRRVSDRLCEEYGLNVLYNTQEMKLTTWKDKDGNIHRFEPTDRKIKLIDDRKRGTISNDDVNGYRNSPAYQDAVGYELSNKKVIQKDIDTLLPDVNSYEELLQNLRDIGYVINDKKVNGEWLAHVTFKAPTQEKGTRDSRIGDGVFYTREKLSAYIESMAIARKDIRDIRNDANIPPAPNILEHIPVYEYGMFDLKRLNEYYRVSHSDGAWKTLRRSEAERKVIVDIKNNDAELYGLYDTSTIDYAIRELHRTRRMNVKYPTEKRVNVLISQIQEGFDNLRFIESKNLQSYEQINNTVMVLWDKYNQCLIGMNKVTDGLETLKYLIALPDEEIKLREAISENMNDPGYIELEYQADLIRADNYKTAIEKNDLHNLASIETLKERYRSLEQRRDTLLLSLNNFERELNAYDRCVKLLKRIDREYEGDNKEVFKRYDDIRRSGEQAKQNEEKKSKKQKGIDDR